MRRRDLLAGLSFVPLAAPAVAQCVVPTFRRSNLANRCEADVAAPSLDLSFMTPGTLDPRITFTRASTGTYFDSAGVLQTVAVNAPRWDYDPSTLALRGLLIEEARTNLVLNSAALSTQSVAVTAQAYTLSFYGTGTITKSGTATGALAGTGAAQRVSQSFTPSAGSLTLTVAGSVTNAQMEAGQFASSYIPTTGVAVTRAVDVAAMTGANFSGWFNNTTGSLVTEAIYTGGVTTVATRLHEMSDGTASNSLATYPEIVGSRHTLQSSIGGSAGTSVLVPGAPVFNVVTKAGIAYSEANRGMSVNGSAVVSTSGGIAPVSQINIGNRVGNDRPLCMALRRMQFWSRTLTDAELRQVTS